MSGRSRAHLSEHGSEHRSAPSSGRSEETPRILLVTNDPAIGPVLEGALRRAGHDVTWIHEGRTALHVLHEPPLPGLLLLDLALPDLRGAEVVRAIRSDRTTRSIPIVVVTSRDSETDRVVAFELGADDFVAVPFSVREVLLRMRVQLRRRSGVTSRGGFLEIDSLRLDRDAHRVWVEGTEVSLSVREFHLLLALMERSERVLTREALLDLVWGKTANVGVRSVDAYITRLRRKLGVARKAIETVSSVGYRLRRTT